MRIRSGAERGLSIVERKGRKGLLFGAVGGEGSTREKRSKAAEAVFFRGAREIGKYRNV